MYDVRAGSRLHYSPQTGLWVAQKSLGDKFLTICIWKTESTMTCRGRRAINAAVRHYLARSGYKLSAITFSEEASGALASLNPGPEETLEGIYQGQAQRVEALAAAEVQISEPKKF